MPARTSNTAYLQARAAILAGSPLCHWCGNNPATEADHLIEHDAGGTDDTSNLVPACKKANYKIKGIKLYESICKCVYKSGYHTDTDYKFRASLMAEYWQIKRDNFPTKKEYNVF